MIAKNRSIPIRIQKEEALLRRLPPHHKKRREIETSLAKRKSGFKGEQTLDYHLSFLEDDSFIIFHDLRLIHDKKAFQIDTAILTEHMLVIIEIKHINGTLYFDKPFNQFIRIHHDQEERLPNPLLQVQQQKTQLEHWTLANKLDPFPIEYLVVNTHPNTILKSNTGFQKVFQRVIHVEHLQTKLEELAEKNLRHQITDNQKSTIKNLLIEQHSPLSTNILQAYNIEESEIITGVQCLHCMEFGMRRRLGTWICLICSNRDKQAHKQAINDYLLLINPTISNQKCRKFLNIGSLKIAWTLLNSGSFVKTGNGRGCVYQILK